MGKMMKILKAVLFVLFLAFVFSPNRAVAEDGIGFGWENGYNLPGSSNTGAQGTNTDIPCAIGCHKEEGRGCVCPETPSSGSTTTTTATPTVASPDIFSILQAKIYSTLVDLRQIVYVIAGFGLVMFAVAAIFNKISYKHLGYIMIGLSLLSLMFPFLEYFSGYNLQTAEQRKLTFKNFLGDEAYAQLQATLDSDITNPDGVGPSGKYLDSAFPDDLIDPGLPTGVSSGKTDELAGEKIRKEIIQAGCVPATMKGSWNEETMTRKVCTVEKDENGNEYVKVTEEYCQGKIKNLECKKTGAQIFSDIVSTAQDVAVFTQGAVQTGTGIVNTVVSTVAGFQGIGDIANSNMSFDEKIAAIANMAAGTWGSGGAATSSLNSILSGIMGMSMSAGDVGGMWSTNYETNPTGENPFTSLMALLGGSAAGAQNEIIAGTSYVNGVATIGNDIYYATGNVSQLFGFFGSEGGSAAGASGSAYSGGSSGGSGNSGSRTDGSSNTDTGSSNRNDGATNNYSTDRGTTIPHNNGTSVSGNARATPNGEGASTGGRAGLVSGNEKETPRGSGVSLNGSGRAMQSDGAGSAGSRALPRSSTDSADTVGGAPRGRAMNSNFQPALSR